MRLTTTQLRRIIAEEVAAASTRRRSRKLTVEGLRRLVAEEARRALNELDVATDRPQPGDTYVIWDDEGKYVEQELVVSDVAPGRDVEVTIKTNRLVPGDERDDVLDFRAFARKMSMGQWEKAGKTV